MNRDFHYYGTYCAARMARFDFYSAEIIAWAAQMVDDFTKELAKKKGIVSPTITVETYGDNFGDEFSISSNQNSPTLQKVRRIWVPFHFLPGNFSRVAGSGYEAYPDSKKRWGTYRYTDERDLGDYQCICKTNSELVGEMIKGIHRNNALGTYRSENIPFLVHLGVCMHVLADTWTHQNFVGSPNFWVNDVDDIDMGDIKVKDKTTIPSMSSYDIFYLGHGRLGSKADYGYLKFSYMPRWRETKISVDNPKRFCSAFSQMVSALRYVTNQTAVFAMNEEELNAVLTPEETEGVRKIISVESKNQENDWLQNFESLGYNSPHVYDVNFALPGDKTNQQLLEEFSKAAKAHQSFVVNYVKDKVDNYFV